MIWIKEVVQFVNWNFLHMCHINWKNSESNNIELEFEIQLLKQMFSRQIDIRIIKIFMLK